MEQIKKIENRLKQLPGTGAKAANSNEKAEPPELIGIVSLAVIVLMVAIDYFFRPQISFALIYLLLVIIATWKDGKISGAFVTAVSVIVLLFNEISRGSKPEILCWNVGVQMIISLLAIWLVCRARDSVKRLKKNIASQKFFLEEQIAGHLQTEEQLHKTMQQLRQLAENVADAFWIKDPQTDRIVYVSPAYEKIWGRNCKELYQSPEVWLETIHPDDRKQIAHAAIKQSAGECQEKFRIVRPDGTLRWIRDRAFPIRDSSGKLIRIVGIAEDITEQHLLERQILEISDAERVRIGQDLHDSLCQKLISIAFDNNSLEQKLAEKKFGRSKNDPANWQHSRRRHHRSVRHFSRTFSGAIGS
jgi:PAS domain S-box-containing protein